MIMAWMPQGDIHRRDRIGQAGNAAIHSVRGTIMRYMLCHGTIPVALLDLDETTGTISGVLDVFAPEHLPVGTEWNHGSVSRTS
jgi:hypothetical protein